MSWMCRSDPEIMAAFPCTLQELAPGPAHFCLGVERFLKQELEIDPADHSFILACSGGLDSTALTLIMTCLGQRYGRLPVLAHLNHGLRPESESDAAFVRHLAVQFGLKCEQHSVNVQSLAQADGIGLEEAGRNVRYAFLERVRVKHNADMLLLAHQLNDLAEDVLMRLARGTGWPALAGMQAYDPLRCLVRPLLLCPRAELQAFLLECGVAWREDASNSDLSFTRNRFRQKFLPAFLEENSNFLESVSRLWHQGRYDASFWEKHLSSLLPATDQAQQFKRAFLLRLHPAERLRLYKIMLDRIGPGQVLSDTLRLMDDSIVHGRVASFQFPGLKLVRLTGSTLEFGPDPRA